MTKQNWEEREREVWKKAVPLKGEACSSADTVADYWLSRMSSILDEKVKALEAVDATKREGIYIPSDQSGSYWVDKGFEMGLKVAINIIK